MKKYIFIFVTLLIFPTISLASSFPSFPMAFYGNVTINGVNAPQGTIISAYYGNTLAGQSTVDNSGAYGYISSTANKLLVSEGSGTITFTFKSPSILSGIESSGTTILSYPNFVEGLTVNKDLAFTYTTAVSSGGGGGSGGGGYYTQPIVVASTTPTITKIVSGVSNIFTTPTIATITPSIKKVLGAEKYNFTKSLKKGSKGNEVIELQKFLNTDGYDCGKADGKFGPKTKSEVIKFQIANKLKGDGNVGPLTRAILNK